MWLATHDVRATIDTDLNGAFGLFLAIWATCFLESWKRKEKTICYIWNCTSNSYSPADERKVEFQFYNSYNENSDSLEKTQKKMREKLKRKLTALEYLFLLIVIIAMVIYNGYKKEIEKLPNSTMKMIKNYGSTTIYSLIIIIFGTLYKKLILKLTDKTNH